MQIEKAMKFGKLKEQKARDEVVQKVENMVEEVRNTEIEYEVPTSNINRNQGYGALTHIVLKGKALLVAALQDLSESIKAKQEEKALRIIGTIKRNDMYQHKAKEVVNWWRKLVRPDETETKKIKFK